MEAIVSLTDRGFTGHEHLQEVGLVHMNGRIYDPLIARFVSADPHIQDPLNTQSLNRYTYVNNNPLAYTDPSGYFSIGKIFKSIFKAVTNLLQNPLALVAIAVAVAMPFIAPGIIAATTGLLAGTTGNALLTGFIGGALSGAIGSGGDLRSTFVAALTGAAFAGIGSFTDGHFGFAGGKNLAGQTPMDYFGTSNHILNVAGHAAVGCASSAAGGGSCQAGALSAGLGAATGPVTMKAGFAGGLAATAAIGGTASVVGGGKFVNGAVTAAFGYLFNGAQRVLRGPGHHMVTNQIARKYDWSDAALQIFDAPISEGGGRIPVPDHNYGGGHSQYNKQLDSFTDSYLKTLKESTGVEPKNFAAQHARDYIKDINKQPDLRDFNRRQYVRGVFWHMRRSGPKGSD